MTAQLSNLDSFFKNSDPYIAEILNRALSEKEISASEAEILYDAKGMDFHLVGMVADELRQRRVGDMVTYVINRNINFTNVCIKQCGFCAFSRDFREEEGYFLPIEEIVRRAKEAHHFGATEVFHQTWTVHFMKIHVEQLNQKFQTFTFMVSPQKRYCMVQLDHRYPSRNI